MFDDARSHTVVFVAHCILNQNAISDGTASFPGCLPDVVDVLRTSDVGIIQMPCPELHCLGLDRGNVHGGSTPIVEENTRIRNALRQPVPTQTIKQLAYHVVTQMIEYRKYGFAITGIVGINRSPSCGVETTSKENQEVPGTGVFVEALHHALNEHALCVEFAGIKTSEPEHAVLTIKKLLGIKQ